MSDVEMRLRTVEIELARIKQVVEQNAADIDELTVVSDTNKEKLDKWGGGVSLMTKTVAFLCTIIGITIAVAKYLSA